MFTNYCIVNRRDYLRAKIEYHSQKLKHCLSLYRTNFEEEYTVDDRTKPNKLVDDDPDSRMLKVVNPFDDVDDLGVDLRPLYASLLWYLACVETIEALNALTNDVAEFGRKCWIIRQLNFFEQKV